VGEQAPFSGFKSSRNAGDGDAKQDTGNEGYKTGHAGRRSFSGSGRFLVLRHEFLLREKNSCAIPR
jgi:hypothetical protein